MAKRDYYEVLGVAKTASDDEIKKADAATARGVARCYRCEQKLKKPTVSWR